MKTSLWFRTADQLWGGWVARVARLSRGGSALLEISVPDTEQWFRRITKMERDIFLSVKAAGIIMLLWAFYRGTWIRNAMDYLSLTVEWTRYLLWFYIPANVLMAGVLLRMRRLPIGLVQWVVFFSVLLDAILLSALTVLTAGYQSFLYWLFLALIIRTAVSVPRASSQLALHATIITWYLVAGVAHIWIATTLNASFQAPGEQPAHSPGWPAESLTNRPTPAASTNRGNAKQNRRAEEHHPRTGTGAQAITPSETGEADLDVWHTGPLERQAEPALVRMALLILMSVCAYGVQVLFERQRKAEEEAREFAMREGQLHAAGRLAAEFTHQMKNPLAIINMASYSLQRALRQGRTEVGEQIQIIQEEVEHADRIITQIMGYAQLSEGRVEKLDVVEELDRAIDGVFPAAAGYTVRVHKQYSGPLPPLLMLRRHVTETFMNLLQNAREALESQGGNVWVSARCRDDYAIEVCVTDDGPGIPPEKRERVFEAYYTTKPKGTGLGLATVKHNVELYGGSVRVESELGKGACFRLIFMARTLLKLEAAK